MTILSDGEIRERLEADLVIDPLPEGHVQPASIDLRLGRQFSRFKLPTPVINDRCIDTRGADVGEFMSPFNSDTLYLRPGDFVLGHTMERVEIPNDLVGVVDGRSSIGRLGVMVHITAGYIDPGFRGQITLEMHNVGRWPVVLHSGDRVCQLRLHQMQRSSENPYSGKYQDDEGAVSSRIVKDHGEEG